LGFLRANDFSLLYSVQTGSGTHPVASLMGTDTHYSGIQWPKGEVDRSSQSSTEVKNAWSYTSTSIPPDVLTAWCSNMENVTFTLYVFKCRGFENNYKVVFEHQAKLQTKKRRQMMMQI
jgi:hypothetical protein